MFSKKKSQLTVFVLLGVIFLTSFDGFYKINKDASLVVWYCQEGTEVHSGSIQVSGGTFQVANGAPTSGVIELDMSSLVDNDLRSKSGNQKLMKRLTSVDFFNTAVYPKAQFSITTVTKQPDEHFLLEGKLTIKGINRYFRWPATVVVKENTLEISSGNVLLEGAQYDLKTGITDANNPTSLRNFKIKISQMTAAK